MDILEEVSQKEPAIRKKAILEARTCLKRLAEEKIEKAYQTADRLAIGFIVILIVSFMYLLFMEVL